MESTEKLFWNKHDQMTLIIEKKKSQESQDERHFTSPGFEDGRRPCAQLETGRRLICQDPAV